MGCAGASETAAPIDPSTSVGPKGELLGPFLVTRVVDGDTIWIGTGSGNVKVRLIGITSAETVHPNEPVGCFGPEAAADALSSRAGLWGRVPVRGLAGEVGMTGGRWELAVWCPSVWIGATAGRA